MTNRPKRPRDPNQLAKLIDQVEAFASLVDEVDRMSPIREGAVSRRRERLERI